MATTVVQIKERGRGGGDQTRAINRRSFYILLEVNYVALFVGTLTSTLLSRFYFVHGGSNRWVAILVQSAGFPLLLVPIYLSPSSSSSAPFFLFTRCFFALCLFVGLLLGVNNLLISWGVSYLSISTSSLILSSQLAFILVLSTLLVHQPLTFWNLNCIILLMLASILLAIGSDSDCPPGMSRACFFLDFAATLGAACLFTFYLPLMDLAYRKVDG